MLSGIGVDIVEIKRFSRLKKRYGIRIASRILTDQEMQQYEKRGHSTKFLASRFAAKEATSKAFGTGIAKGIGFHTIEVINNDEGKPELKFYGAAERYVRDNKITRCMLSLSDERKYTVAMVVLEANSPAGRNVG